jgi:hypothetical protein
VLLGMLLLIVTSCNDFLDVNVNPNAPDPDAVSENVVLGGVLSRHAYQVIGNWPARFSVKWLQQIAWNGVPPTWDNYDVLESNTNAAWQFSYANVIKNAMELDRIAAERGNYAFSGVAKVIIAWNLSILTDLFGDIPYTEAFNPETGTTPAYDSQEDVYEAIFDWLEAAIEDFGRPSPVLPGAAFDMVYRGNVAQWERLAYTLMARYHMRLSSAPGNSATARAQAALDALANGFTGNADNAVYPFVDAPGSENPWHQYAIKGNWDTRDQMSATLINMLQDLNDPRLPVIARPIVSALPDSVVYVGHVNGTDGLGGDNVSRIGNFFSDADADLIMVQYAEAKFIEAEATLILNGAASADPIYRDAVRANLALLEVDDVAAIVYVASLPDLTEDNALEEIMTQKYIANFLNPEVYNDWRRTRYPVLEPVSHMPRVDLIPVRYPYPLSEWQNNESNVQATGVLRGYPSMTFQVWWDPN